MTTEDTTVPQSTANAAQAEAEGAETATVEWRDLTPFEVPLYRRDWPFAAVVALERTQWPLMLHELLPEKTLAEIRLLRLTENDVVGGLLPAMFKAIGFRNSGE
jgi:hypothetical protein